MRALRSPQGPQPESRYLVPGLVRGLELLRCFDGEQPWLSLTDLARRLGTSRSGIFRPLYTLEHLGYLERDPRTKRYRLAPQVLDLGYRALASLDLTDLAQSHLERLRDLTLASAHLGILDGHQVRYVGRAPSRLTFASNIHIGSVLPAHATAMGKALLAWRDPAWLEDWLASARLEAFTPRTHVERESFLADLARTRERGYAISDKEYELGIRALAAPILGAQGVSVAAINLSGPEGIFGEGRERQMVQALVEAAAELSKMQGWRR